MKKAKGILILLLIIWSIAGGAFYWKSTLYHVEVIAEPTDSGMPIYEGNPKSQIPGPQEIETQEPESKESEQSNVEMQKSDNRVNILVLGTDNRGNEVARSDLIMLVTANVDTKQVAVISIPRDTRVNFPGVGLTKINHANAVGEARGGVHQGTLESAKVVSNLLALPIHYYIKMDFKGFERAIDAVGGINVNFPYPINDTMRDLHLAAGQIHLSGDQALRLARARYGLPHGDFDRQSNQFTLLSALAHQMLSLSNIPKLPEMIEMIHEELMDTNMSTSEMAAMGLNFKGITNNDIKYYQLPGKGISARDPLVGANVYYYEPDLKGVKEVVKRAITDEGNIVQEVDKQVGKNLNENIYE